MAACLERAVTAALPSRRDPSRGARMGNSALRAHVETAQKTGVFQLKDRGLTEVRPGGTAPGDCTGEGRRGRGGSPVRGSPRGEPLSPVPFRVTEADEQPQDHRLIQQQDREPAACDHREVHAAQEPLLEQQQTEYGFCVRAAFAATDQLLRRVVFSYKLIFVMKPFRLLKTQENVRVLEVLSRL